MRLQIDILCVLIQTLFLFLQQIDLFWRIHMMDTGTITLLLTAIVTATSTYLLSSAYKNVKFILKHKIAQKKGDAIAKEVAKQVATDKSLGKREKDDRVLFEKNEVSDYESMTFSIFYINLIFLTAVVLFSTFIVGPLVQNPNTNYVMSVLGSAGLSALLSN